jgi:sulfite reductase beta subunit-like hemoprotein/TusA-related sulfurtransferase
MKFYENPPGLEAEIDAFARSLSEFLAGELHPTKFRAIRVPFGVYEQRTSGTFMIRIRATAGGITPRQLEAVALLAEQYGSPQIHVTTRQELQLHDARLQDTPEILRQLLRVGLSTRGGGGNTVRNIMASYDAGLNAKEVFDVTPHAVSLTSRLIAEGDSWNLPRKFKVSFSATAEDNALAAFNDLGFIAARRGDRRGFTVFVAGGMGCRPRLSKVLHDFIDEDRVYHVCSAIKRLYLEHGNRKTKNSGRIRFLWEELGSQRFLQIYRDELAKVKSAPALQLDHLAFANSAPIEPPVGLLPKIPDGQAFTTWKRRYVEEQKQEGLFSIRIPLALGDISSTDAIKLGRFLGRFGENVLRLTMSQNIHLRNIPQAYLGNVFELVSELGTLSHLPSFYGEMIGCTGADTCTTGVCLPQRAIPVIQRFLQNSGLDEERLEGLRIHISGCPNSCGQHHVGDLGFYGRVARKGGRSLPAYWVTGGASLTPDTRSFTDRCGWVAARDLPRLVGDILLHFQQTTGPATDFHSYFQSGGKGYIAGLCEHSNRHIPLFEHDSGYYHDWGVNTLFTTAHMGHGECSAGIYDMIEVSMTSIKECQSTLAAEPGVANRGRIVEHLIHNAASMLLVTRGLDPATDKGIYQNFVQHFIDQGLIAEKFRPLVVAALDSDTSFLTAHAPLAVELGDALIHLYHSMDNSLNFTCKVSAGPGEKDALQPPAGPGEIFKDLRGVACPMNFVKTKVELSRMRNGQRLRILLDDGEPIDNVPRSVKTEGHAIISQEKNDGYWSVVIEKEEG